MTLTFVNTMATLNRSKGIGGSDASRIMRGEWRDLYLEKIGEKQPDDLSGVFRVQLGLRTENFHAEWFARMSGFNVVDPEPFFEHPTHKFMFGHVDRWITTHDTFLEMKHSSNSANLWDKARYYAPQLQHYMAVTNRMFCYFSVIRGNDEPQYCKVDRDDDYIEKLIELETSFWWHVENRVAPDIIPTAKIAEGNKASEAIKVDGMRVADMTSSNAWANAAKDYLEHAEAAKKYDAAKDGLKELVGDDVGEAYGHGVVIKRDKRGRLLFKAAKEG
jgi:predicted phage-related endonuclease